MPKINESTGARDFDISIKRDIKCWAEICPWGVERKQWEAAQDFHEDKLEMFSNENKPWQRACQEDDFDVEAEKIYSDVKNLHFEKYFNDYQIGEDRVI